MGSRNRKQYIAATALRKVKRRADPPINPAALKRAQEQPPPTRRVAPALPQATPNVVRSTKRRQR